MLLLKSISSKVSNYPVIIGQYLSLDTVITNVFPDEFHLNTLDQLLPAIARLNPHVNIKAIVIGLMDRLSMYAERESESESPEERQKAEEHATAKLLEKLAISKEAQPDDSKSANTAADQPNGDQVNGHKSTEPVQQQTDGTAATTNGDSNGSSAKKSRGIPEDVKLFEIFYGQVTSLVHIQRLPIQDTIALLVSLAKLAL